MTHFTNADWQALEKDIVRCEFNIKNEPSSFFGAIDVAIAAFRPLLDAYRLTCDSLDIRTGAYQQAAGERDRLSAQVKTLQEDVEDLDEIRITLIAERDAWKKDCYDQAVYSSRLLWQVAATEKERDSWKARADAARVWGGVDLPAALAAWRKAKEEQGGGGDG